MKLCKDCKHATPYKSALSGELRWETAKCNSPKVARNQRSVVDGSQGGIRHAYCETQRMWGGFVYNYFAGMCGKSGRFFEPKDDSPPSP